MGSDPLRDYAIELEYKSLFPRNEIVKRNVLLELGFARVTPHETKDITSWSYERAIDSGLSIEDNRAKQVMTYRPEYTFIEKLDAINRKYQGERPAREWVRHYYDVFMLLQEKRVQSFIGSEQYRDYMSECFGDGVNLEQLPAFLLNESGRFEELKRVHEAESGLYFESPPTFDEIAFLLRKWLAKL